MPVYEQIGKRYDETRRADREIVDRFAHHLQIKNAAYLDVACSTGNYTVALSDRGGIWHGIDQSERMVNAARSKSKTIQWQVTEAEALPYPDAYFSGVLCTLAIHHFQRLIPAFREIYRTLATGQFVLFTATPEQMRQYWLVEYFPEAIERSIQQMPSLETVRDALEQSGFHTIETEPYVISEALQDLFLYSGKHRPELYLDANIRAGISTFSLLASPNEIEMGCQRLASDITTGVIKKIMSKYKNDLGDYMFIIARK